jgi:diaminopimelate decarboxylase
LEFLDFGGGFGPRYFKEQEFFPLKKYIDLITQQVSLSGLQLKAVALEPGKYIVADAGALLLRVEYIKESYGNLFACVSGGTFNSIPRPVLYPQAKHQIINCSQIQSKNMKRLTVAGNLCETGDIFGQDILMPPPKRGDILAVLTAGAYCRSMASRFNMRDIPREIMI